MRDKYIKSGSLLTAKRYTMVINKLKEYIGKEKLEFETIDLKFLQQYEAQLLSSQTKGEKVFQYKLNTVNNHLKTIKAIFFNAMKEGLVDANKNPFFFFKLKVESNVKKEKLSVEEIIAIENLQLDEYSLIWNVRNYFLFSFYCAGIRISDLIQLKWENITKDGRIEYKMDKTGGFKSIILIPKALLILEKYRKFKVKQSDFVFPILDERVDLSITKNLYNQLSAKTALINKYLKKVAAKAEIEKPLTTHIARHSFSDIARKKGANLYDISKMLGHSSIKITEAYLSSFDQDSQDTALKSILDY
jgi:site-specific recombinase XerD